MKYASMIFVALVLILFPGLPLHAQSAAGKELNQGVQSFRAGRYEEAVRHFERAVALAPTNVNAHLYLATAYSAQFIPGVDTPDNLRMAEAAIQNYQAVLDSETVRQSRINSAKNIASLSLNMKRFEDARKYNLIVLDLDPKDPEPYYSLGVIAWTRCYQPRMEQRARLGLRPEDVLNPANKDQKNACDELKVSNAEFIAEGIDSLKKAIELRPDYDDAMAYLNLMYRERADLECGDQIARDADFKTANEWVDRTLAVKEAKARKAGPSSPPPEKADPTAPNPQ